MKTTAHILVIRLSAMGDVAMTIPVLLALAQQHPHLKITLLTNAFFAPMFRQLPNVSIMVADVKGKHKGVLGLWKLYKTLKMMRFDAVADLHNVLRSIILKQFFRTSAIPFVQVNKGRAEKKRLTASENKHFVQLKSTHQRYADVFTELGYQVDLNEVSLLQKETLSDKILNLINLDNRNLIGIAPFAAFEGKKYPLSQMAEVIEAIKIQHKYKIVLFGGGQLEKELIAPFTDQRDCINCIGELSFNEELALVSNLKIMLAMDSGNAHLAAMYNVPTITLWGITHPYAGFAPFKQDANVLTADRGKYPLIPTSVYGNKAPKGYENAISSIAPATIVDAIAAMA